MLPTRYRYISLILRHGCHKGRRLRRLLSVDGGTAPVATSSDRNGRESDLDLDLRLAYSLIYPQNVTIHQMDDLPNADSQTEDIEGWNTSLGSVDGR